MIRYKKIAFIISFFLVLAAAHSQTQPKSGCNSDLVIVDTCFTVHGRLTACNGNPSFRIWIIGTKRYLGVDENENFELNQRERRYAMPADLFFLMDTTGPVWGDFTVCPLSKYHLGVMQSVCIRFASKLVVKEQFEVIENEEYKYEEKVVHVKNIGIMK